VTLDQIAKSGTEAAHQTALFAFVAVACNWGFDAAWEWASGASVPTGEIADLSACAVPELRWLHHIPNGGSRGDSGASRAIRGAQLKAQGVRAGVADLCLPVRRGACSGLYVEMKKPSEKPVKATSKGGVSEDQRAFGDFVKMQGYGWIVCYGWQDAASTIEAYLSVR
jgi:hypothetical protein